MIRPARRTQLRASSARCAGMLSYNSLSGRSRVARRTATRLLALRAKLDAEIPARTIGSNVLLATWNLREFDSPAYGMRPDECLFYIAEIISRFDIVAIQEVREDL